MSVKNIVNSLRTYNSNYYRDLIANEILENFQKTVNDYINNINQAINNNENEEFLKNIINRFLKENFYNSNKYQINTDQYIDSTIKTDGILHAIIETKKWNNNSEMLDKDNINKKAFWELVYYYLENSRNTNEEKVKLKNNVEIRRLIATDGLNWFIFDSNDIERLCSGEIEKLYYKYKNGQLSYFKDNSKFYSELRNKFESISITEKIDYIFFNLNDYKNNLKNLKNIYKIFSKTYLLKEKYNGEIRANTLNEKFYQELLYILGLKEQKESSKSNKNIIVIDKTIKNSYSYQLYNKFVNDKEMDEKIAIDKTFELLIIWIDRLLFLKLFEGQLLAFNGEKNDYRILTNEKIKNFDDLQNLFFDILGKKERSIGDFYNRFSEIPYLNSSLFEKQIVEINDVNINELKDLEISVKKNSVLGKNNINSTLLKYTIDFFNSYIFGAENIDEGIYQNQKDIIDSSVLGLIFEKINGYRDGAFYTPSPITEYMSRNLVEKLVIEKLNKAFEWNCINLEDIKFNLQLNRSIETYKKANSVINNIKICDPAVGSGHFLVSVLNQLLVIKAKLGIIFIHNTSELLNSCEIFVQDDILMIADAQGNQFSYNKTDKNAQQIQETIFNEKRTIIENCLFGVDINPKAVYICQLRLWIELLKNAYYKNNVMETLPNIDINIKSGNSLASRLKYNIDKKINYRVSSENNIKVILKEYKDLVKQYKSENDKKRKKEIRYLIDDLKKNMFNIQLSLFEGNEQYDRYFEFNDAFEWAVEFPEIISEDCKFEGFDGIIGNPPYGLINKKQNQTTSISTSAIQLNYYKNNLDYKPAHGGVINIYRLFVCLSKKLLKQEGICSLIFPSAFLCDLSATGIRKLIVDTATINYIEAFPERDNAKKRVFENVKMSVCIVEFTKTHHKKNTAFKFRINDDKFVNQNYKQYIFNVKAIKNIDENYIIPLVNDEELVLLEKITENSNKLINYSKCYTGEIDISLQKKYITTDTKEQPLLRGAQIQKYYITNNISQGELFYLLKDNYLNDFSGNRAEHHKYKRIGMQGITGVNEKDRLKMTIIDKGLFCANSINYLLPSEKDIYWILALLNSKLINWYFKKLSTNSNVNGYEIDSLPIKIKEDKMNQLTNLAKMQIEKNSTEISDKIDKIVYEIYNLSENDIKIIEKKQQ